MVFFSIAFEISTMQAQTRVTMTDIRTPAVAISWNISLILPGLLIAVKYGNQAVTSVPNMLVCKKNRAPEKKIAKPAEFSRKRNLFTCCN